MAEPEGQSRISSGLDFEMLVTFFNFFGLQMLLPSVTSQQRKRSGRAGATRDARVLFIRDLTLAFI